MLERLLNVPQEEGTDADGQVATRMQKIQEALNLQRERNVEMEADIDLRIRAEKLRLIEEMRRAQGDEDSYDGEDGEGEESEESEGHGTSEGAHGKETEPKVYEIVEGEEENAHDVINIQVPQGGANQTKITAGHSSISDAADAMGTLMSNRT